MNLQVTEKILTEKQSQEIREKYIDKTDVLDKVKKIFLIPKINCMTMQQVASFYEVSCDTIKKCYQRNKSEIDSDGTPMITVKNLKGHFVPLEQDRGGVVFQIADNVTLKIPNRGVTSFSKRAVLRIGMLLRDSHVAQEVRSCLLDTVEKPAEKKILPYKADEEEYLQMALGKAMMFGDTQKIFKFVGKLVTLKNKQVENLIKENQDLSLQNKALSKEVLSWKGSSSVNKAIRVIAGKKGLKFSTVWSELYDELLYKHGICLASRGKTPLLRWVKNEEWGKVIQSLTAICEKHELNVSEIFSKAKLKED